MEKKSKKRQEQEREKSRQLIEYWQLRALTAEGKFEQLRQQKGGELKW